jgi:uncharacterized protein (TIGR00251 family)
MSNLCYGKSKNGIYLKVKVIPKSSRNGVIGLMGDRIKVSVKAAPQNGEANEAVRDVVSDFFGLKKNACIITAGHKTSHKTVFVETDPNLATSISIENKIKQIMSNQS